MLGDQIQPHAHLSQQSRRVEVSVTLAVLSAPVDELRPLITFNNTAERTSVYCAAANASAASSAYAMAYSSFHAIVF
jgi:hypothetical protein